MLTNNSSVNAIKLRIVIVDYFKGHQVAELLESLSGWSENDLSISVVDNSCSDENFSKYSSFQCDKKHPNVSVYQSPENIGYSKACNIGAQDEWDYALFLNPDIEFVDFESINRLLEQFTNDHQVGCAGVCQQNPDGGFERIARRFPSIKAILAKRVPVFNRFFEKDLNEYLNSYDNSFSHGKSDISVDWLQSSLLMVSRQAWDKVGGFDERFFVFMADVDFGKSCKNIGFSSVLIRDSFVKADGLRSSRGGINDFFKNKIIRIHIRDAIKYYFKWAFA